MFEGETMKAVSRAVKRMIARKVTDEFFKAVEKSPVLRSEGEVYIDFMNTGLVVNISKPARKFYPRVSAALREIVEKELKKL